VEEGEKAEEEETADEEETEEEEETAWDPCESRYLDGAGS
jgi:hypothetical protein